MAEDTGALPLFASEEQIRAQDAEEWVPMYYPPYPRELVEVQQQQCMGNNVPVRECSIRQRGRLLCDV